MSPAAIRTWAFHLCLLALAAASFTTHAGETRDWLPGLLERERITVVVTDSGLGGLSVVADAVEKFRAHGIFREVDLVFVNALFTNEGGYNSLTSRAEKLQVFDSALRSMAERYHPDVILVACNTLSVLVPDTAFVHTSAVPVTGIVDQGVEQIAGRLQKDPSARNIILATQTTVDEGTHEQKLLEMGIGAAQVVPQACPQLTLHIEQGFDSEFTEMLIDAYVDEALSRVEGTGGPLTVSFNCTHFGYSLDLWKRAFESRGVTVEAYLDPNTQMIDFLTPPALRQRFPEPEVTVKVVSMIDIPEDRQDSIGRWLQDVSPATGAALRSFELRPDLFEWRSLVSTPAR